MGRQKPGNANRVRDVRLVRLVQMLQSGIPKSRQDLEQALEVSRATLTRDIETLRNQLNMPIAFDRDAMGYVIGNEDMDYGPRYELPGIWLSASQATAVLALVNVCLSIDPGVLGRTLRPIRFLMKQIAGLPTADVPPVWDKLSIELPERRDYQERVFEALSDALYRERKVILLASAGVPLSSSYSPLRFALTPEGWFLDAIDDGSSSVSRFNIDILKSVVVMEQAAMSLYWDGECWVGENGKEYKVQVILANKQ